jgi:hypothetical protein
MNQKFQVEKGHFTKYLQASNQNNSCIEMPETEPPDLQFRLNNKKIGVEHSRIKSNSITKNEKEFDKLTKACDAKLRTSTKQPLLVDWELRGSITYSGKQRTLISLWNQLI